jgi:hypothetical protein
VNKAKRGKAAKALERLRHRHFLGPKCANEDVRTIYNYVELLHVEIEELMDEAAADHEAFKATHTGPGTGFKRG